MKKETNGLAIFAVIYFIFLIIPHFIHFLHDNQLIKIIVPTIAYIFLALFGIYILHRKLYENLFYIKKYKLKSLGIVIIVFLAMTAFSILGSLMSNLGHSFFNITQTGLTNDTNVGMAANILPIPLVISVLGILGPFVEEIFYRYILFNLFKRHGNAYAAILLSSLCFALIHVNHFTANELLEVLPHFMIGLVFAYTYHKTDNLLFSSIVHIFNNTFMFLFM
jgi:hypothetical protein